MGIFSFFKKKTKAKKLYPESSWIVEVKETVIKTVDYKGNEKEVNGVIRTTQLSTVYSMKRSSFKRLTNKLN